MQAPANEIDGFREEADNAPDGTTYTGRLTLHDIQWTHNPDDILATSTITAQQLLDAAENRLIWIDQRVHCA